MSTYRHTSRTALVRRLPRWSSAVVVTATISCLGATATHAASEPSDPLATCTPIELAAAYIGVPAGDLNAAAARPTAPGRLGMNVVVEQLDAAESTELAAAASEPDDAQRALATWSVIALHDAVRQRLLAYALSQLVTGIGLT